MGTGFPVFSFSRQVVLFIVRVGWWVMNPRQTVSFPGFIRILTAEHVVVVERPCRGELWMWK
ncbi:conserved hypothetical protein [Ricinus communis]|uniref:Uncharacterized protein n=1 Tax=Ricinus communis TaxID=3988 RepID=B9SES6_RICCO|nr:conserved hypothetical protein [Ricinus communis]